MRTSQQDKASRPADRPNKKTRVGRVKGGEDQNVRVSEETRGSDTPDTKVPGVQIQLVPKLTAILQREKTKKRQGVNLSFPDEIENNQKIGNQDAARDEVTEHVETWRRQVRDEADRKGRASTAH